MDSSNYSIQISDQVQASDLSALRAGSNRFNIQQVPELEHASDDEVAVLVRDNAGDIEGGVVANMDWDWLYVDLLWLDDSLRSKGMGRRLMGRIEQFARSKNVPVYLMTTEFQALPFYQHLGYELFATLLNRPHGYAYYYLRKSHLIHDTTDYGMSIVESPDTNDRRAVNRGLRDYCERFVDCSSSPLAGFIRPQNVNMGDGDILGGIWGISYWDWYDMRLFWVDESLRGQVYGKKLLEMAIAECRRRGLTGIVCDVADFQSLVFMQSQGFEIFATLPDRPRQHTSYFMKLMLNASK